MMWLWNDYHKFSEHPLSHRYKIKGKKISLWWELLGITILTTFTYNIQLLFSRVRLFMAPWAAACQASPSITISQSLFKVMSMESMMPSNHLVLYHLLLLSIRVFSNELALRIRWSKYWSFSISPFNEYSGLFSFRIDWFDLLAVQGTLKSHLQHHGSKASILWCSAFFMVHLSHPYMTTGETIALTVHE